MLLTILTLKLLTLQYGYVTITPLAILILTLLPQLAI